MVIFNSYVSHYQRVWSMVTCQTLPHLGPVSRYLERCIEAFRSTLRQFAMKDLRDYAERGCEVVERVSFV